MLIGPFPGLAQYLAPREHPAGWLNLILPLCLSAKAIELQVQHDYRASSGLPWSSNNPPLSPQTDPTPSQAIPGESAVHRHALALLQSNVYVSRPVGVADEEPFDGIVDRPAVAGTAGHHVLVGGMRPLVQKRIRWRIFLMPLSNTAPPGQDLPPA